MGFLSGKEKSKSYNVNNDLVTGSMSPVMDLAGSGGSAMRDLLLGGDAAGFNRFKDNAGFNFAAKEGTTGVLGNMAAKGLLRSGASGKALVRYGEGLNQQYLDKYLERLLGMSNLGIGAGGLITQAGQVQKSSKKGGLQGLLGTVLSGGALG